jgi:hypothetical protein
LTQWISGNAELHQVLPVTDNHAIRVFMGVNSSYFSYTRDCNRDITNFNLNHIQAIDSDGKATFYGVGPRWGGHLDYNLPSVLVSGFSLYGEGAAGILLGKSHLGVIAETTPVTSLGTITIQSDQFSIVYEFDARLGLNYHRTTRFGLLSAECGWLVFEYLSAVGDRVDVQGTDILTQGFFAGVKWQGDFA